MKKDAGQITLPFVLLIGVIIVEIALAGVFVSYLRSISNLGERLSVKAGEAAYSGIQDAMVRIAQNKELGNSSYELMVGEDKTEVTITKTDNPADGAYAYVIDSLGISGSRRKKLQGVLIVDKITGRAKLDSTKEVKVSN